MNAPALAFRNGADIASTIAAIRKSFLNPLGESGLAKAATVSTGTGLVNYDLQAPAKNLYPVNTPIRNRLPRVKGKGDVATRWKSVYGIASGGLQASPWVNEGNRAGVMSLSAATFFAGYSTIGQEINLTYEAWSGAEGFEDEKARNSIRLLQQMMLSEEDALIGGNTSLALGTPTAPAIAGVNSGGTIAAGTYNAKVVQLTYEGYRNWQASGSLIATGLPVTKTVTDPVGASYTINGGSSAISAASGNGVITGTGVLSLSAAPKTGAVAYAWYVNDGAAGAYTLQTVTLINSVVFKSLTTTGQNGTAITADHSTNPGAGSGPAAFDGLLYAAFDSSTLSNPSNAYLPGGYVKYLATGTAGAGTKLTASGAGTVNEIDDMLLSMWNNYQVSPTVLFMNAQELQTVTKLCLTGNSAPLLQYFTDPAAGYAKLSAGGVIEFYFNPFTMGGGTKIPVMIHPTVPPGTIFGWCEDLPLQYQSNEVPNVAEVHCRRDYYQIDWPPRTRLFESGVYAEECLAIYAPFAVGIITNIAKGP